MLTVSDLSFWYSVERNPVIYRLGFSVNPGEVLVIVGGSGGGKSTLIRLLCGLEQAEALDSRLEGSIKVEGRDVAEAARRFSYVPQSFEASLVPFATVSGNLELAVSEDGVSEEEKKLAATLLHEAGIAELADRYVTELSGGQQQRVAICRALMTTPRFVLMDEPFANLDPVLLPMIGDALRAMQKRTGIAFVIVTHNVSEGVRIADRVLGMRRSYALPKYRFWDAPGAGAREEIEQWLRGADRIH